MKVDQAVGVDLRSASLCIELDCNTVFDATTYRHCPRCGNAECYPLALWLDRAGQPRDADHDHAPRVAGSATHRVAQYVGAGPRLAPRYKTNGSREPLVMVGAAGSAPGSSGRE